VRACGSCHRSEGTGGPENLSLAGLSVAYFVQQMVDFKSGARKFSGPQRSAVLLMNAAAKAMTDAEVQAAAEYFSALKPKQIVKVIESDTIPKTYIARLFFVKRPEGGTEPLGRRIIEMPDDVEQFELRDTRSQFTAYVRKCRQGRSFGQNRRVGYDNSLCNLPWAGAERRWLHSQDRRTLAELHCAAALRLPAGGARGKRKRLDEADRCKALAGRHDLARRLHCVA
jgi:hypothetical protein